LKKITLITTGQPATNPRLVKEVDALIQAGYDVKAICCFYQAWAGPFDREILNRTPGVYIFCGGDPINEKASYFITRLRHKINRQLFSLLQTPRTAARALSRTHAKALAAAKKIKSDLYIAHNLGALPAAAEAAKYHGAKVGYDAEDMHSGQFNSTIDPAYLLNKYVEEKYFPQTDYFTAASPLIAENYRQTYPYLAPVTINNVFPRTDIYADRRYKPGGPLKLFWFSQTIGADRGLEDVVRAIAGLDNHIELHLLGQCSEDFKKILFGIAGPAVAERGQIQFHDPVSPDELFEFTLQFDIGLATETSSTLNRDICLTNKIFTYVQCGLALLMSDTSAQSLFLQSYPGTGRLYQKNNPESLTEQVRVYIENPDLLVQTRAHNHSLGQRSMNWETESALFLDTVEKTLNKA